MAEGGYDVEFVEKPNVPLKTECLICHLILRDPCETECCGNYICKVCAEEYEKRKADCFLCRKNLKYREAPAHKRLLSQLKVYCTHREQGCQWKGELSKFDGHLNFSPYVTSIDTGCDFTEVECPICNGHLERHDYSNHMTNQCPSQEIPCIYHKYGCQWRGERRTLEEHMEEGCGYVSFPCEFDPFGCQEKFMRKDIDEHMSKNVNQHLRQLCQESKSIRNELLPRVGRIQEHVRNSKDNVDELNATIQQQKQRIEQLEQKFKQIDTRHQIFTFIIVAIAAVMIGVYFQTQSIAESSISVAQVKELVKAEINGNIVHKTKPPKKTASAPSPSKPSKHAPKSNPPTLVLPLALPYNFIFHDYDKYLETGIEQTSETFVSFEEVLPVNFYFTATLSIHNDLPALEMCFHEKGGSPTAVFYVQLVNQKAKTQFHHVDTIQKKCDILIPNVEPQFIVNNQLHIRILSMELDGNKNPPYMFSLCQYRTYFISASPNKMWTSNPFYSSPGGFQFTLEVYPNGIGSGLGTHLSLVIVTDEDDMDPFNGNITVFFHINNKALNVQKTVEFNGEDERAIPKVLTQSEVQNHILDYDCIILGISSINVK